MIQLSKDLNKRFGKGFSDRNLRYMRRFFQFYKLGKIRSELFWSYYRALLLVEDFKIRDRLQKEAIEEARVASGTFVKNTIFSKK
ncbi:PF06250 domain protein [Leptospira noguchii str. 1993005606]|nr:PF06250 domain protein [Leptospira noguchii str. 1993005606]